jgi:hypothetical protein
VKLRAQNMCALSVCPLCVQIAYIKIDKLNPKWQGAYPDFASFKDKGSFWGPDGSPYTIKVTAPSRELQRGACNRMLLVNA